MSHPQRLLERLAAIGVSVAAGGRALALIGLGSVGRELERLDEHSDLDFFLVVRPGEKAAFLQDLSWLSALHPVAYAFQNTPDGYKLLYTDDIFCEFAVFEPAELAGVPFAAGRIIWKAPEVDEAISVPPRQAAPGRPQPREWLLGEALTCLYIGLKRHRRGEKLSALRFVQSYAVDRLIELAPLIEPPAGEADQFAAERRFEQRFPQLAPLLPAFQQGYEATPASALALLAFLEQYFTLNPAMVAAIRRLADQPPEPTNKPAGVA